MSEKLTNLQTVRLYLKSLEEGASPTEFFAPEIVMEQLPNRIYPKGLRAGMSEMAAGFEKGKKLLSSQRYEIKRAVENANVVALEVLWIGQLAIAFGSMQAGSEMRAHSAMFLEFHDGKIISQRNYDCFESF